MLYKCHRCNSYSFHSNCVSCGSDNPEDYVPLDPEYYPEFQYQSRGFVKDLFVKKKTEKELGDQLQRVLEKWRQFEDPYFVNYLHLAGRVTEEDILQSEGSRLDLFERVLVRLGFDELRSVPFLTVKLIRSTSFRFHYADFVERTKHHIKQDLKSTIRSWIEERGQAFRRDLHLLLYMFWERRLFQEAVGFSDQEIPLVSPEGVQRIRGVCENIYLDILVDRFQLTLEQFDPARFMTMYAVDAMDGYVFEEFLGSLLRAVGYDIQETKKSGDQGADLFAEKFGRRLVIQAKNYSDNVGNAAVQQVLSARSFYSCDEAMVITNSYFTNSAKELAEATGVRLVDRTELEGFLDEYNRALMETAAASRLGESGTDDREASDKQ